MDLPQGSENPATLRAASAGPSARTLLHCALAVLLCLAALWLRQGLAVTFGDRPLLILFMFPILLSALLGGFLPGLVATASAAACTYFFFIPPAQSLASGAASDVLQWGMLVASGLLTSALSHALQRTRRREAEQLRQLAATRQSLTESERRFQAAFEQAAVGIALVGPDGRWLRVNRKLCEIVGYGADELLARTFQDITHPDDLRTDLDQVGRLLRGEISTYTLEKRYVRKDGSLLWIQLTVSLVRRIDGEPDHFISVVENIQARKAAEEERRLFSEALRQASQPLLMADAQFHISYVNPAFSQLLGYAPSDLAGRHVSCLTPPDPAALQAQAEGIVELKTLGRFSGPLDRLACDGTVIPLAANIGPVRDARGEVVAWVASYLDLRPLREKDKLLRMLALAIEQSPANVVVTDLESKIEYVNDALLHDSGYSRAELLGTSARSLLSPQTTPELLQGIGEALARDRRWRGQLINRRKEGSEYTTAAVVSALQDERGRVTHFVAVQQDITDRLHDAAELERYRCHLEVLVAERTRQLEEVNRSLSEQQQFVRNVADAVPALVGYFDPQLYCRFANAAYLEWWGLRPDEVVGLHARELIGDEMFRRNEPSMRAALRGESPRLQRALPHTDGSLRETLIAYVPDRQDGQVRGFIVVVSDITEIKVAEQQMAALNAQLAARAIEAEGATRAKSAFLANMSHEIRTPMNAIIGLTHLMARDTRDSLQRERLGKIDSAAKHLLQIINDVLDLSKIDAGKLVLEDTEFNLDEVLSRAFELVGESANEKGLELVLDTDRLPSHLRGDPTRLSQALINLLANAVKFTHAGWVRLRGELLAEDRQRVQVRFEVQDTGEGIEPERFGSLFNAFEQADASTTRRHGGTGLGLALTQHLVTLMGGEMGVRSEPGVGSTFWFTAWLGRAAEAGERASAVPLQGLRALLVDDLPEALSAIGDRLQHFGLRIDPLDSGTAALQRVRSEISAGRPYDVFLIDWRMEPLDGIETMRQLRELLGAGMPPAILVTAFNNTAMWQQARGVQADAVLVKPITASALHDTLMRVLRSRSATRSAEPAPPGQGEAQLLRRHAGQRVLLAEDNPINQEVANELLQGVGLVVETAVDGASAVELACSRAYDLILMDMQMPEMDGIAATRAIRARLGRAIPIVAMTANAFSEDRQACLDAGMNDHVAKPVDPGTLYATLLRWLPLVRTPAEAVASPPPPRLPLQQRLDTVEGFDLALGLNNVGRQFSTLVRVLGLFVKRYGEGEPALLDASEPGAAARWAAACHSLRGASGTLGARRLVQHLVQFEQELHSTGDVAALAPRARQLHEELLALVQALQAALD
ncbi:PAS/PAC sensor hybrid histidine kinase [Leptothrix cholodnii SP-6]|uniref:Virulence sensor protein BvgS n=1 Tax=Leptothrix cholodnii (strain ATCC 51168 / LMG 8142 / SP-6) TaxID=395495 RepID=B1XWX2_LEPCP|nr:PAS domain S-box protein [Leptothrix cholodnii]ACB36321.1 PAS/PAC sensor hybrid histidine kinase [Leptothrix cholodnii SP-6]